MFLRRIFFILLAVLFSVMGIIDSGPVFANGTPYELLDDEIILKEYFGAIVVAVVVDVYKNQANTNEDPPRLVIDITEIVKGKAKLGYVKAYWEPVSSGIAWGRSSAEDAYGKTWLKERCAPPDVGTKWILCGAFDEKKSIFHIGFRCRYEFSEEKLKRVKSVLKL